MSENISPKLFRDYDIRGIVPWLVDKRSIYFGKVGLPETNLAPIDVEQVYIIARAFAEYVRPKKAYVGRDTRLSSDKFFEAFARGLNDAGVDVVNLGTATTGMFYYASGKYGQPAISITASHTTREINGFKLVKQQAKIIGAGSGMEELRDIALAEKFSESSRRGDVQEFDILDEYVTHAASLFDLSKIKKFKVVFDTSNGPMYRPLSKLLEKLDCDVVKLNFEPDGNFPNHDPNPLIPGNRKQLQDAVLKEGADLGVIWDGDADRVMFIDEKGDLIPGDFLTVLFAEYFLKKSPGAAIIYDARSSWAVRDHILALSGRPVMWKVGHAFIKQKMREENAIFGGEVSGHYYFKDTFFAENDLIPLLITLKVMTDEEKPFSQIIREIGDYFVSGEINFEVEDRGASINRVKQAYAGAPKIYFLDGVSVEFPDWHFNVRLSANDPVVRLNVETLKKEELAGKIKEVAKVIGGKRLEL